MKASLWIVAVNILLSCNGPAQNSNYDKDTVNLDTAAASDLPVIKDTNTLAGQWYLQPVLPSDTATGKIPQLVFNMSGKTFKGNTGCNNMSGTFTFSDTTLVFNPQIGMTKMVCPGYNETGFIENLLRVNRYKFEDGVLILLYDDAELSRWTRTVEKKPRVIAT